MYNHNSWICGTENPRTVYESLQISSTLTFWCATSKTEVIRPYYFDGDTVTRHNYIVMSRYYLLSKPENYISDIIYQQDGASLHYAVLFRQYLKQSFQTCWCRGVDQFCGLYSLLTWHMRLLSLRLPERSSILWSTLGYPWPQDKLSSSYCESYQRNTSKGIQKRWKWTFVRNPPKWGLPRKFIKLVKSNYIKPWNASKNFSIEVLLTEIWIY